MHPRYVVLIGIGALCAGVALGDLFVRWELKPFLMLARSAYNMAFVDYVDVQHYEGTPEAYEAALTEYLRELSAGAKWRDDMSPASLIAYDQALTYVRLSQSQAQRGAAQESARSLASAVAFCAHFHSKGCTEDELLAIVKRIDERRAQKSKDCEAHGR